MQEGRSVLMIAADRGDVDIVRSLMTARINHEAQNKVSDRLH